MPVTTKRQMLTRAALFAMAMVAIAPTAGQAQSQNKVLNVDIESALAPDAAPEAFRTAKIRVGGETIRVNYGRSIDLAVYFPYDSAQITPQATALLNRLGQALNAPRLRGHRFLVAGHTDAKGDAGYNRSLSDRRARAVTRYLARNFGILPYRLVPAGFGESRLADKRRPEDPINRRVEITLIVD